METIYLTGYHGTGKSIIGKMLASRKNLPYIDTDLYVKEELQKKSIDAKNVEQQKKEIEKELLKNFITQGMVVVLGAEIVDDYENIHNIKTKGRVIYFRAKPSTIYTNLQDEYTNIPSLKNAFSIFNIEKNVKIYEPYYEELANYILDVDEKSIKQLITELIAIYNIINKRKCHIYIK